MHRGWHGYADQEPSRKQDLAELARLSVFLRAAVLAGLAGVNNKNVPMVGGLEFIDGNRYNKVNSWKL